MNFKLYLNSPRLFGLAIVKRMTFLPDKTFLQLRYLFEMGKPLNLKNPRTFQEKIQWLKLYNRKPEYTCMVDKAAVKDYVANIIGSKYVIPTLGIWERFDDIDFDALPNRFVLKTTHGGGGGGVVICKDKSTFNLTAAKHILERSLKQDIYKKLREWPYKDVPRRIIAEQLLEVKSKEDLIDYKVFCFNGKPKYIQAIQDRHSYKTINFFDTDWNSQEFYGLNLACRQAIQPISRPYNLDDMIKVATMLAKGTDFVRVDLYEVDKNVYFGELTFYPAFKLGVVTPEEWGRKLGEVIDFSQIIGGGKYLIYSDIEKVVKVDDLQDYKFFCFSGEPCFFKVDYDRFTNHHANYFDMSWNLLPFGEKDYPPVFNKEILPPPHFDTMINIARKLSRGHSFLRVDLYNLAGEIYFGELTFYPASGLGTFTSVEWDEKLGEFIDLSTVRI